MQSSRCSFFASQFWILHSNLNLIDILNFSDRRFKLMHHFSIIGYHFHVSLVFCLCGLFLNFRKVDKSLSRLLILYDQLPTILRRILSFALILIIRCCRAVNIFEKFIVNFRSVLFFGLLLLFVTQQFIICQIAFIPVRSVVFAYFAIIVD
jgi:hypothetical protein